MAVSENQAARFQEKNEEYCKAAAAPNQTITLRALRQLPSLLVLASQENSPHLSVIPDALNVPGPVIGLSPDMEEKPNQRNGWRQKKDDNANICSHREKHAGYTCLCREFPGQRWSSKVCSDANQE